MKIEVFNWPLAVDLQRGEDLERLSFGCLSASLAFFGFIFASLTLAVFFKCTTRRVGVVVHDLLDIVHQYISAERDISGVAFVAVVALEKSSTNLEFNLKHLGCLEILLKA